MPEWLSTILFLCINGLIWGMIIALISLGLSLIFGVMGIVNMAHGDFFMVGAVLAFTIFSRFGNFWISLAVVPVLIALVAIPTERYILRPFEGNPSLTMIATIGLSFIIQQIALATYGGVPKKLAPPIAAGIELLGVHYPVYRLLIALISGLVLVALWIFLYKTSFGILVRASMQDASMAQAMGINVNRVLMGTFALGAVLAAVGGVLAAPVTQVSYLMGNDVILLSFIVVIIGGLGSLKGTLIAALSICSVEGMLAFVLTPTEAKTAIFIIMVGVLIFRPEGLFDAGKR